MDCRPGCGACCIAPSISSPIPGMPDGKPAHIPCVHLTADYGCALFGDPSRPQVCIDFKPALDMCGTGREEALIFIAKLEAETS